LIPYHGTPITPATAAAKVLKDRHAFVSFRYQQTLEIAVEVARSFAVDCGAFTAWKQGEPAPDWGTYLGWVRDLMRYPSFDFAIIPDVIDGSEEDNDRLVDWWHEHFKNQDNPGVPVWHLHERPERLDRLCQEWPRVALGSSGEYATPGTEKWWARLDQALRMVCDDSGRPAAKLHGLRMLDPALVAHIPFASADSTNVGRNIGIDSRWNGSYQPPDVDWRALVLAARAEAVNAPTRWAGRPIQQNLFEGT
jgi:hypothetical protein